MKAPFFTVLIDTYNYGGFIEDAVASVLGQNFPAEEREILVVDDGSTDDTQERLQKFGEAIRYFKKPNGGQASAFNFGFEQARGAVIALLDADDVWLPEKLGRVYEAFERHSGAGMVYHRVHLWDGARDISEDVYFAPVSGRVTESRRALLRYPMVGTFMPGVPAGSATEAAASAGVATIPGRCLSHGADHFCGGSCGGAGVPGKYRLHGANLFQANAEGASRQQLERRMAVREALLGEIENWLKVQGENVDTPEIRAYLKQWIKAQEATDLQCKRRGRWKYFQHLVDFPANVRRDYDLAAPDLLLSACHRGTVLGLSSSACSGRRAIEEQANLRFPDDKKVEAEKANTLSAKS